MKFHHHVSFSVSTVMCIIGVIQKTFCSTPMDTFLSLYDTLAVHNSVRVWQCDMIWGPFCTLELRM